MTLRLSDKWLWDFWFAQDGADYHIFYLQAARSLVDPERRHWNVSIGHAVSTDLQRWQILPDAIRPDGPSRDGLPEAWDSYTTWTGSIIRHENRWYMFYTGSKRSEKGLIQRIGLATSADLMSWQKHPDNPLIEADPQWYETLDLTAWHDQAWRDPWVFRHPETGDFHAFITARVKGGPPDGRGVIGHARSGDLIHWDVLPPLTDPGEFGHMEVPQVAAINGRYYLLFSTPADSFAAARDQRTGLQRVTGTHYLAADSLLGSYRYLDDQFLVGDAVGSLYSGKIVQGPDSRWYFFAFRDRTPAGEFLGELSPPMPVTVDSRGALRVTLP